MYNKDVNLCTFLDLPTPSQLTTTDLVYLANSNRFDEETKSAVLYRLLQFCKYDDQTKDSIGLPLPEMYGWLCMDDPSLKQQDDTVQSWMESAYSPLLDAYSTTTINALINKSKEEYINRYGANLKYVTNLLFPSLMKIIYDAVLNHSNQNLTDEDKAEIVSIAIDLYVNLTNSFKLSELSQNEESTKTTK